MRTFKLTSTNGGMSGHFDSLSGLVLGELNKSRTEINLDVSIAITLHMEDRETPLGFRLNQWLVMEVGLLSGIMC